jgi:hypothetical protein
MFINKWQADLGWCLENAEAAYTASTRRELPGVTHRDGARATRCAIRKGISKTRLRKRIDAVNHGGYSDSVSRKTGRLKRKSDKSSPVAHRSMFRKECPESGQSADEQEVRKGVLWKADPLPTGRQAARYAQGNGR